VQEGKRENGKKKKGNKKKGNKETKRKSETYLVSKLSSSNHSCVHNSIIAKILLELYKLLNILNSFQTTSELERIDYN
jgi:hypothetical protein